MAAHATFVPWTPEDDLSLKNAVEAGASLASLAKGAVQFSQKKTAREIRDRWCSLFYNPIISAEASSSMNKLEFSSPPLPSKFSKLKHLKERNFVSVKRKRESIRSSYYALHKRVCNNTFTSMDLSLLFGPEMSNYKENGDPLLDNCMPEGAATSHSGSRGDPMRFAFPEYMMDCSAHILCTGVENLVEKSFPIEQRNILEKETQIPGDIVSLHAGVEELSGPQELSVNSLSGDFGLERMPLSAFDQIDNDPRNMCPEFDGNHIFDSTDIHCGTSFYTSQLSPLPEIPIWRTDVGFQEPDVPCDDLNTIGCGEAYLAELPNSLVDFSNELELYLADANGSDGVDNSYYDGLSSLFSRSSKEISADQIPRIAESETSVASQGHVRNQSALCHAEIDYMGSCSSDVQLVCKSEVQIPSFTSAKDPQFPELTDGIICCTLNTEDPAIPSNDHVSLPSDLSLSTCTSMFKSPVQHAVKLQTKKRHAVKPKTRKKHAVKLASSSVEGSGPSHRTVEIGTLLIQGEQKHPMESHVSSQMVGSSPLPGSLADSKVKCEMPNSHASHVMSLTAVSVSGASTGDNSVHAKPKEETTNFSLAKHLSNDLTNSSMEKPARRSNIFGSYSHSNDYRRKQESDVVIPRQDHQLLHAEPGSSSVVRSKRAKNPSTSEKDEQDIDNDEDIPSYSDIEAMILDTDLDPDDQDLYDNEEVSKHQHQDMKRTMIWLEQGAQSHLRRAFASHGAFAILYGYHSKYYIQKPEVLIGRATDNALVDIDLDEGGHANKISRRQAIIKMDKVGSFYLKNLGKSSIFVNDKEVHPSQSERLHSSCLIEVRGTSFIFETDESCVKQYLNHFTDYEQTP